MSARWSRAKEAGESSNGARTTQTYILGIGASGALLAGAGVALISLVGLVSFDVWPGTPSTTAPEEAQLNFGAAVPEPTEGTSLSEAAGVLASAAPLDATGTAPTGGGDGGAKQPASDEDQPPDPAPAPAPAPTETYVPAPDEPEGRVGTPGSSKSDGKSERRGEEDRSDPLDDPDEPDPAPAPPKDLPGRTGDSVSRDGSSSGRRGSDSTRGGRDGSDSTRGGRDGPPSSSPSSATTPSYPSSSPGSADSGRSGSRRSDSRRGG